MSYFSDTREPLALPALNYEADNRILRIGEKVLAINQQLLRQNVLKIVFEQPEQNDLGRAPVCLNHFGKPIGMPRFHDWLGIAKHDPGKLRMLTDTTQKVMKSVLKVLDPVKLPRNPYRGRMGFNLSIDHHNHATLQTFGDCACLGQNPDGLMVDEEDWEDGFCEYDFHNVDTSSQHWSLLAGLGHLACLASKESDVR